MTQQLPWNANAKQIKQHVNPYITEAQVRARLARERENDYMLEKLHQQEKQEQLTRRYNEMEKAADRKRRANDNAAITAELVMTDKLHRDAMASREHQRRMEQDEQLANALAFKKAEDEMKLREIQRICEEDEGLRELQDKLKTAYVTKERMLQMQDKEFQRQQEKEMEYQEYLREENQRRLDGIADREKEERLRQQRIEGKHVIEAQMKEKEDRLATEAAAVAEKEKRQIDDIMRKIAEEDAEVLRKKREMQEYIQGFIRQYIKDRDEKRKREKIEQQQEMEKIAREAAVADERARQIQERKDALQARRDALYDQICAEANRKIAYEEEMERYREILYIEEEEQRLREMDRVRAEKQKAMMDEMMRANHEMQAMKAEKMRQEQLAEEQIAEEMRKKFEEDLRREREEFERNQEMKRIYCGELQDQIKKRQEAYRIEIQREQFEIDQEKRRQEFKRKVVEEARKRLLQQHAVELNEYLPKGVIMNEDEYSMVYGTNPGATNDQSAQFQYYNQRNWNGPQSQYSNPYRE